jgi:hypothetical protein
MSAASDAASFSRTSETTAAFSAFGDVVIVALWLLSNKENGVSGAGARTLQRTLSALRLVSRSSSIRLVWQDFRLIHVARFAKQPNVCGEQPNRINRIGLLCEWSG